MKRYNLNIPADLYEAVEAIATRRQTSVVAVLRHFIKLGLLADKIEQDDNMDLLVREGNETKVVKL